MAWDSTLCEGAMLQDSRDSGLGRTRGTLGQRTGGFVLWHSFYGLECSAYGLVSVLTCLLRDMMRAGIWWLLGMTMRTILNKLAKKLGHASHAATHRETTHLKLFLVFEGCSATPYTTGFADLMTNCGFRPVPCLCLADSLEVQSRPSPQAQGCSEFHTRNSKHVR